jgi:hypothetical protein
MRMGRIFHFGADEFRPAVIFEKSDAKIIGRISLSPGQSRRRQNRRFDQGPRLRRRIKFDILQPSQRRQRKRRRCARAAGSANPRKTALRPRRRSPPAGERPPQGFGQRGPRGSQGSPTSVVQERFRQTVTSAWPVRKASRPLHTNSNSEDVMRSLHLRFVSRVVLLALLSASVVAPAMAAAVSPGHGSNSPAPAPSPSPSNGATGTIHKGCDNLETNSRAAADLRC